MIPGVAISAIELKDSIASRKDAFEQDSNSKLNTLKREIHSRILEAIDQGSHSLCLGKDIVSNDLLPRLKQWLTDAGCKIVERSGDQRDMTPSFYEVTF